MKEFQITCVVKPNRSSAHEHITHIGNLEHKWMLKRETAVVRIESKQESYYTVDKTTGKRAHVSVVREQGKVPYLRTHADGKWNDNLLAQAECAGSCAVVA